MDPIKLADPNTVLVPADRVKIRPLDGDPIDVLAGNVVIVDPRTYRPVAAIVRLDGKAVAE